MKGQCKICRRVFEGENRNEVINQWSEHNNKVHLKVLQGTTECCGLVLDEGKFV